MKESYLRRFKAHPDWWKKYPFWFETWLWEAHDLCYMVEVGWQRLRCGPYLQPILVTRIVRASPERFMDSLYVFHQQIVSIRFPLTDRVASKILRRERAYLWEVQPDLFAYIHGDP